MVKEAKEHHSFGICLVGSWSSPVTVAIIVVRIKYLTVVYSPCAVSCLTLWVAWLSISCQAESNCRLSSSRSLSSARAMVSFAARRISMARWNSCVALWASTWACGRYKKKNECQEKSQSWCLNMPASQNKALISSLTCKGMWLEFPLSLHPPYVLL